MSPLCVVDAGGTSNAHFESPVSLEPHTPHGPPARGRLRGSGPRREAGRVSARPYETADGAVLELGAVAALDGVCDAVAPKRWKATRAGITVVAAQWKQCAGSKGTVRLAGKLIDGCRRFRGTLAIGKSLRSIVATRIECGERCATASTSNTVVGEVAGGQALIALVRDADGVTAYTCGIGTNLPTRTGWFFGASTGDALPTLTSADGLQLTGRFDGGYARGTLTLPDGKVLPWEAEPTRPGSGAGLYESEDALALTGSSSQTTGAWRATRACG